MTTEINIFTHPITLILLGGLITGVGYLITTIVGLIKDNSKLTQATAEISEILKHVVSRQDKADDLMGDIKNDLQELLGEHRMMLKTGQLIAMHSQKKT